MHSPKYQTNTGAKPYKSLRYQITVLLTTYHQPIDVSPIQIDQSDKVITYVFKVFVLEHSEVVRILQRIRS